MLAYITFYGSRKLTYWVSRYELYSTLYFASGRVANSGHGCPNVASAGMRWSDRRNRLAITRQSPKAPTVGPPALLSTACSRRSLPIPSLDSFSSRLASHEIQRTRQLLHASPKVPTVGVYLLRPCSRLQFVQLRIPG